MSGPWEDYAADDGPWNDYASAAPQPVAAPRQRTALEEGRRQAGLMGRMALDTVAALPLAALEGGAGIGNLVSRAMGGEGNVSFRRGYEQARDRLFPQPEGAVENVTQFAGNMLFGSKLPSPGIANPAPAGFQPLTQAQRVLQDALKAGYVVPPTTSNPTATNKVLEGISGKLTTAQLASAKNQSVTTNLAKRAVGLPDDLQLTPEALREVRAAAWPAYEAVKGAGTITADDKFVASVNKAVSKYQGAAKDFKTLGRPDLQKIADDLTQIPEGKAASINDAVETSGGSLLDRVKTDSSLRESFAKLRYELGWDTVGGRAMGRERPGFYDQVNVEGSTPWLPKAEWFGLGNFPEYAPGQRLSETEIKQVIDLVLAGKTKNLGVRQKQVADYLAEVAAQSAKPQPLLGADELADLSQELRATYGGGKSGGLGVPVGVGNGRQFEADSAVDAIRALRDKADSAFASGDKAAGQAYKAFAGSIEDLIGRHLKQTGDDDALKAYQEARKLIAKTHSVERALNPITGQVSGTKLARQLERGKPLSGELRQAASFATAFPKAAREFNESLPGISPLDFYATGGTAAMTKQPWWLLYPFIRQGVRQGILSPAGQNALALPSQGAVSPQFTMGSLNALLGVQ